MNIAKYVLLRSPLLQRAMCAMGLHWWRIRLRYGYNLMGGYGWWGKPWSLIHTGNRILGIEICHPLKKRCYFCGKEK